MPEENERHPLTGAQLEEFMTLLQLVQWQTTDRSGEVGGNVEAFQRVRECAYGCLNEFATKKALALRLSSK